MTGRNIYLIGSLRNPQIPLIAQQLREDGHEVFDDWYAAGPNADDHWRDYERGRGHSLPEALRGFAARHVYAFDKEHLERADTVILVLPCGKSGHLELGVSIGRGKDAFVLVDDPERWDVMYQFASDVFDTLEGLRARLKPVVWFDANQITEEECRQLMTERANHIFPYRHDACGSITRSEEDANERIRRER